MTPADGGNGFVESSDLREWFILVLLQLKIVLNFKASKELGWNTGVCGWLWQGDPTVSWIKTIYPYFFVLQN